MADTFRIDTHGLTEFNIGLGRLVASMPETSAFVALAAANVVTKAARPDIPVVSGRAAASLQAYQTGGGAVSEGGGTIAYYRWLELGGAAGGNYAVQRPVKKGGRYIQPAYERSQVEIQMLLNDALTQACKDAGLEVD